MTFGVLLIRMCQCGKTQPVDLTSDLPILLCDCHISLILNEQTNKRQYASPSSYFLIHFKVHVTRENADSSPDIFPSFAHSRLRLGVHLSNFCLGLASFNSGPLNQSPCPVASASDRGPKSLSIYSVSTDPLSQCHILAGHPK